MPQYVLVVEYNGSRFHGFQRQHSQRTTTQDNGNGDKVFGVRTKRPRLDKITGARLPLEHQMTVQDLLECAILQWTSTALKQEWSLEQLTFRVAGRTDKGVHARGQVVTIHLPSLEEDLTLLQIRKAINSRLPIDISVSNVVQMTPGKEIDPRSDAKHKQYSYTLKFCRKNSGDHLASSSGGVHAFRCALSDPSCLWSCPWPLDDTLLDRACRLLQGTHNYSAFVHKAERAKKDNTITVTRFEFQTIRETEARSSNCIYLNPPLQEEHDGARTEDNQPVVVLGKFLVEAKGFRRTMVRNLVGFVVDVSRGLQSLDDIDLLWTGSNEAAAKVQAAPASGLCLEFVKY